MYSVAISHHQYHSPSETGEPMMVGKGGPMFRIGPTISESDSTAGAEPGDPNGFAWCLMNLAISKLLMGSVRKVLNTAGVEVIGALPWLSAVGHCALYIKLQHMLPNVL